LVEKRFEKAKTLYLDENALYENFQKQLKMESTVVGKRLILLKENEFSNNWKKIDGVTSHLGT
jgi:hypothetical protein